MIGPCDIPYLTAELPGVGGVIKSRPEDFRVDEVPAYEASGAGDHTYFRVHKMGVPTNAAVERIARHMGVSRQDIGVAGLKDAHAVTTQWMSLEHVDDAKLASYRDSQVRIETITRHGNKLKTGHLIGNTFTIRIREAGPDALTKANAITEVLARRGVPNFFGPQRFGARGDTGQLGAAIIRDDPEAFVRILLGDPRASDPDDQRAAREAFDAGDYEGAMAGWPGHYGDQRRALKAYRKGGDGRRAIAAIDKRMRRLYVSAFQSEMFNAVLARRLGTFDTVLAGDWAQKHDTGGVFLVEDGAAEAGRAERFEISATGPMVGYKGRMCEGEPGAIEQSVMDEFDITPEQFRITGPLKVKGARRALRFAAEGLGLSAGTDEHGEYLELQFGARSGCYATVVTGEIMKSGPAVSSTSL
jgi:tRNA pseudouridine13 synthase